MKKMETPRRFQMPRKKAIKWFKHWRSKKIIRASDYGLKCFWIK